MSTLVTRKTLGKEDAKYQEVMAKDTLMNCIVKGRKSKSPGKVLRLRKASGFFVKNLLSSLL